MQCQQAPRRSHLHHCASLDQFPTRTPNTPLHRICLKHRSHLLGTALSSRAPLCSHHCKASRKRCAGPLTHTAPPKRPTMVPCTAQRSVASARRFFQRTIGPSCKHLGTGCHVPSTSAPRLTNVKMHLHMKLGRRTGHHLQRSTLVIARWLYKKRSPSRHNRAPSGQIASHLRSHKESFAMSALASLQEASNSQEHCVIITNDRRVPPISLPQHLQMQGHSNRSKSRSLYEIGAGL